MVQRHTQVNGVHRGRALPVLPIELIEINALEHKGRYLPIIEADAGEVAAAGQQIGSRKISVVSYCWMEVTSLITKN